MQYFWVVHESIKNYFQLSEGGEYPSGMYFFGKLCFHIHLLQIKCTKKHLKLHHNKLINSIVQKIESGKTTHW